MKLTVLVTSAALVALAAPSALAANRPQANGRADVAYTILLLKEGKPLATRTVVGRYGEEVRVEVPDAMRVVVSAQAPDAGGQSFTSAQMSVFADAAWSPPKKMSMEATLSMTPSFEYSVEGAPYRFVVMPRAITRGANQ